MTWISLCGSVKLLCCCLFYLLTWFWSIFLTVNQSKVVLTECLYHVMQYFFILSRFDENENEVNRLLWPSRSPDLKPAEVNVGDFGSTCEETELSATVIVRKYLVEE